MKAIQTKPDCTLQFIACPIGAEKTVYTYPEGADPLRWKPIGRLSEITEEQAKELVSIIHRKDGKYQDHSFRDYTYVFGERFSGRIGEDQDKVIWSLNNGVRSLKTAALSVGIEEKDFDKHLVIKL